MLNPFRPKPNRNQVTIEANFVEITINVDTYGKYLSAYIKGKRIDEVELLKRVSAEELWNKNLLDRGVEPEFLTVKGEKIILYGLFLGCFNAKNSVRVGFVKYNENHRNEEFITNEHFVELRTSDK